MNSVVRSPKAVCLLVAMFLAVPATAWDGLQWSGFALARASSANPGPPFFDDSRLSSEIHLGVDWRPSLTLGAHLQVLARDDADGSRRGIAGIPEAYLEGNFHFGEDHLRILGGAFFLPASRENIDALWESPYTITSSALNSWMGEEFRPIGIDVAYTARRSLTVGATLFRGNDTFGALPVVRGWALRDHLALLGEHLPVDEKDYTSVSAETDDRLGWSGRVRWSNQHALLQLTHLDNRSDARQHGELLNWDTRFDIAGAEYTISEWTVAAEIGCGTSAVMVKDRRFDDDLRAGYLLVSRRLGNARASLRAEEFRNDSSREHAVVAALFWSPLSKVRMGIEAITSGGEHRVAVELRYRFAGY